MPIFQAQFVFPASQLQHAIYVNRSQAKNVGEFLLRQRQLIVSFSSKAGELETFQQFKQQITDPLVGGEPPEARYMAKQIGFFERFAHGVGLTTRGKSAREGCSTYADVGQRGHRRYGYRTNVTAMTDKLARQQKAKYLSPAIREDSNPRRPSANDQQRAADLIASEMSSPLAATSREPSIAVLIAARAFASSGASLAKRQSAGGILFRLRVRIIANAPKR